MSIRRILTAIMAACLFAVASGIAFAVEVNISNKANDGFVTTVQSVDKTVTIDRTREYAHQRLTQFLKDADLPHDVTAQLEFAIGVEGEMQKDPIKDPEGSLLSIGGTAELPYPNVKAVFNVTQNNTPSFSITFEGGNFNGSKDWDGVKSIVDMSIGHLMKEFGKRGIKNHKIVDMLANGEWIPKAPYVHIQLNFGKVRIHQDGNLWEALSEIGSPAKTVLEAASKDKDPEVADEAKLMLDKLKTP